MLVPRGLRSSGNESPAWTRSRRSGGREGGPAPSPSRQLSGTLLPLPCLTCLFLLGPVRVQVILSSLKRATAPDTTGSAPWASCGPQNKKIGGGGNVLAAAPTTAGARSGAFYSGSAERCVT